MKKLNRKGFTLIELLAVIVILAIIVVVTVPTIINTIEDARVQSIWNLAGSVANSYDTMKAQDLLVTNKILEGIEASSTWQCFDTIKSTSKNLTSTLDLSSVDLKLSGTAPTGDTPTVSSATCSAIRIKPNGSAEVLLVANYDNSSKFHIANYTVYAISSADTGVKQARS